MNPQMITNMLVNELNAANTQARQALLQTCSQNNYNNQLFSQLQESAMTIFQLFNSESNGSNPPAACDAAVKRACHYFAAIVAQKIPALYSSNPGQINAIVAEYQQQMQRVQQMMSSYGNNNNFGMNVAPVMQQFGNNGFQNHLQSQNLNAGMTSSGNSGLFVDSRTDNNSNNNAFGERSFGSNQNVQVETTKPVVQNVPTITTYTEVSNDIKKAAEHRWRPTPEQPYRFAYEPSRAKLNVQAAGNNFTYNVVDLEPFEMDEAKHRISPIFDNFNEVVSASFSKPAARMILDDAVSDAVATDANIDTTNDSYGRLITEKEIIDTSMESLWTQGRVEAWKRAKAKDQDINVFQWRGHLATPFTCFNEDAIKEIRKFEFSNISNVVTDLYSNVAKMEPYIIDMLDKRLTKVINHVLRINLSIPKLKITSAMSDWNNLVDLLEKKYGELFIRAFNAPNVQNMMNRAFRLVDEKLTLDLNHSISDEDLIPVYYFQNDYSFTYINLMSGELDIDWVTNTGGLLTRANSRTFYKIGEKIMNEFGAVVNPCDRHFISTKDNRILEISLGWLAKDSLLISLVK